MDEMDEVLMEGPADGELVTLIHGWPDDLRVWDDIVEGLLSTGKYRCLRVTLPGYGDRAGKRGNPVVDPNFHEAATMVADVIKHHQRNKSEQTALVIHDWGSAVGIQLQRLFPELVSRMVICDVGPVDNPSIHPSIPPIIGGTPFMIFVGLWYQWANSLSYLLWRYVPIVGVALGDAIHHVQVRRFRKFPDGTPHPRTNFEQSASAAYFYHHFQKDHLLDKALGFSLRGGSPLAPPPEDPSKNPSCPTLFLYGNKGLGQMFVSWRKELERRPDSDVAELRGTHWFMLDSPSETRTAVVEWLGNKLGGKLEPEVRVQLRSKL